MTPSRRPPLPIWSGWPRRSEIFSKRRTPWSGSGPVRIELEAPGDLCRRIAAGPGSPSRESRTRALRHESSERRGAAADRNGLRGVLDLDALEDIVDAVANLADLSRGWWILGDQLVGEHTRPDPPRANLLHPVGHGADDHLGGATAYVHHADSAVDGMPSPLVAPMKERRPSSSSLRTSTETPAISATLRAASSPFDASRIAAVATARMVSAPSSRASRTCVATTSATCSTFSDGIYPRPSVERLVDPRIGPLLHDLLELAVDRLRHEHARRIRADIYSRTEHGEGVTSNVPRHLGSQPPRPPGAAPLCFFLPQRFISNSGATRQGAMRPRTP